MNPSLRPTCGASDRPIKRLRIRRRPILYQTSQIIQAVIESTDRATADAGQWPVISFQFTAGALQQSLALLHQLLQFGGRAEQFALPPFHRVSVGSQSRLPVFDVDSFGVWFHDQVSLWFDGGSGWARAVAPHRAHCFYEFTISDSPSITLTDRQTHHSKSTFGIFRFRRVLLI